MRVIEKGVKFAQKLIIDVMKKIYCLATVIVIFSSSFSYAQQIEKSGSSEQQVFTNNLKLSRKCFVDGQVPSDFPDPAKFTDEKVYKSTVYKYIKENPSFFVVEELEKNGLYLFGLPSSSSGREFDKKPISRNVSEEDRRLKEEKQKTINN